MSISISMVKSIAGKLIPSDVKASSGKILGAVKKGRKAGVLKNAGAMKNIGSQTKSIYKEVKNLKFTKEETPAVVASIVALIPIPSPIPITPIVYGIGKTIQKISKIISKK